MGGTADGLAAGIDLGGTYMRCGVVDGAGRVLGRVGMPTWGEEGVGAVIDRMAGGVRGACEAAGVGVERLSVVGVGAPAPIDTERGVVTHAPNLRWRGVALAAELSARLGGVRVFVDNDVNAAAYGEFIAGCGPDARGDLLAVWIGTGVGGGVVLGGRVQRGACLTGGEVGQMILMPRGEVGARSVEDWCSRTAMARGIAERGGPAGLSAGEIAARWREGDAIVREVVRERMELLGVAVGSVVTLLGVGRVVVGGGVVEELGEEVVGIVRESTRKNAFYETSKGVEVVATVLREDAGVVGAAGLARGWGVGGEARR